MSANTVSQAFIDFIKSDSVHDHNFRFEVETDTAKIIDSLRIVERLYPDQVLMLCNRSHPKLTYIGSNCKNIFGFSEMELIAMHPKDFFHSVHPEDRDGLQQCFELIRSSEPYDPLTHRFVLYYRFKINNGNYIHLKDEKLAIKNDNDKYIYFSMFRDITSQEKFFHVKLDVFRWKDGNALKIRSFDPRQEDHILTSRQNEILHLITQGLSTKEIADRLKVSVNTVRNHKQILFRKVNVRSSMELIHLTRPQ